LIFCSRRDVWELFENLPRLINRVKMLLRYADLASKAKGKKKNPTLPPPFISILSSLEILSP
jgi:hypothetical protein